MAQGAPSVPANRDGVGGDVVLNNGAGPLGTTRPPNLPTHQSAITFSKQTIMWPHHFTGLTVFTVLWQKLTCRGVLMLSSTSRSLSTIVEACFKS